MIPFRMELRRNRTLVIALVASVGGYAALMGLMYPILRTNDDLMRSYMETFPKEFLAAFGMTGVLSDPGVFFTTYIGSWLWPIIAAAAGLLAGTRATAADLDRGFLDLALSTRLSRVRYLGWSIVAKAAAMATLAASAVLVLWATGTLVGAPFDLGRFAVSGVLCFAFGCAIAGAATLFAVLTLSRGTASAIVGGALLAMYAVFVITQVAADWRWLGPVSAWNHFPTTRVIDEGYLPWGDLALFAVIAVGCWAAALIAFRRRDLAA